MSLSTTLQLVKALVPTGSQSTNRTASQQRISWEGAPPAASAFEAVLLIVNQDIGELNDPSVETLLGSLYLQGRSCAKWIDAQTTVHIVVRAYADDQATSRALGLPMLRRLLGDQFEQERLVIAAFEDGCGGAGMIFAQWRPESAATAITTQQPESAQVAEYLTCVRSASDAKATASMSHWSWWAERSLANGSCA